MPAFSQIPTTVPTISGHSRRMMSRKYGPTKVCQMLVTTAGTMTMASACEGCMVTASRPIDTVGRPSPIMLVTARRDDLAGRRQIDFQEVRDRDFVGLTNSTALQIHIARHAARLGVRLKFRARLRDFDAICQMVAADVGIAVVPEAAAKRCARTMPIMMIRIRDPWANRKLTICARSFKTLPRPAKLLVEHLRKAAQR